MISYWLSPSEDAREDADGHDCSDDCGMQNENNEHDDDSKLLGVVAVKEDPLELGPASVDLSMSGVPEPQSEPSGEIRVQSCSYISYISARSDSSSSCSGSSSSSGISSCTGFG